MQVNLALVQINTRHFDHDGVAKPVTDTTVLTAQHLPHRIKLIVVILQRGDVHQAFHINITELHKQAKAGHRTHRAAELFTHAILHIFTLQPILHIVTGGICAALSHRTDFAKMLHVSRLVRIALFARQFGRALDLADLRFVFAAANQIAQSSVHQQIRITPDRRREVRVRLKTQPEVTNIVRLIHRLQHRTHQHGLNQIGIGPIRNRLQYPLIILGFRLHGLGQHQPQLFQIHVQIFKLVRIRPLVHAVQHRQP